MVRKTGEESDEENEDVLRDLFKLEARWHGEPYLCSEA